MMHSFTNTDLTVSIVRNIAEFKQVKKQWENLCDQAIDYCPMVSHAWLCAWWEAFGQGKELYVVLIWKGDRLVGGAPLIYQVQKIYRKKRMVLTLASNTWVDRTQFLLTHPVEPVLACILDHVYNAAPAWEVMILNPIVAASTMSTTLAEVLRKHHARFGILESLQSPFLELPQNWDSLFSHLSTSFRKTIKRKIRKAEKIENLSVKLVTDASCIDAIMDISLDTWQHEAGTSMASQPDVRRFYTYIIQQMAKDNTLRVGLLEIGGEPVAFEFNLACRSTLHNLKLGFRKRYGDLSPGVVLKSYVLKTVCENPEHETISEYDFMGIPEPYKLNWTKILRTHNSFYIFNDKTDLHLAHWLVFTVKPWIRHALPWIFKLLKKTNGMLNLGKA